MKKGLKAKKMKKWVTKKEKWFEKRIKSKKMKTLLTKKRKSVHTGHAVTGKKVTS